VGSAATLGGMTRMTITMTAILTELTKDAQIIPALIVALMTARVVGNRISRAFDDGMMEVQELPYLEEAPPDELTFLTARNAMNSPVVTLPSVAKVARIIEVLDSCKHNGFPVVYTHNDDKDSCIDSPTPGASPQCKVRACSTRSPSKGPSAIPEHEKEDVVKFGGIILRRQILVLLKKRVWENHDAGIGEVPRDVKMAFVGSFLLAKDDAINSTKFGVASVVKLTDAEKEESIDLRAFCDPAPFFATELMPLSRVYRMFNEIGARHLPVLNDHFSPIGMITRKDLNVERMTADIIQNTEIDNNETDSNVQQECSPQQVQQHNTSNV